MPGKFPEMWAFHYQTRSRLLLHLSFNRRRGRGRSFNPGDAEHFPRAIEGVVDIAEYIILSDFIKQFRLFQSVERLGMDIGYQKRDVALFTILMNSAESIHAGWIDRWDVSHADDPDFGGFFNEVHRFLKFIRCAEKERTVDFVDLDAVGNDPLVNGIWIITLVFIL